MHEAVKVVGKSYAGAVRCYRMRGDVDSIAHLAAQKKFASFQALRQTAQTPDLPSFLFVEQLFLPNELLEAFQGEEGYVIAFTVFPIDAMQLSSQAWPSDPDEHLYCTATECPGFPVPKPQAEVFSPFPYSFDESEAINLFGDYAQYAGKLLVINLHMVTTKDACARTIRHLLDLLHGYTEYPQPEPAPLWS